MKLQIRNGRVVDPASGKDSVGDVYVADGRIAESFSKADKTIDAKGAPRYSAIYELESPDVLTSPAFAKAVDEGRWATHVRPYTRNRQHTLYRVME